MQALSVRLLRRAAKSAALLAMTRLPLLAMTGLLLLAMTGLLLPAMTGVLYKGTRASFGCGMKGCENMTV